MAHRPSGGASDSRKRPIHNAILAALPRKELAIVRAGLEFVELPTQTVLHDMGRPIRFAYFMEGGLASILHVLRNGKSVEVGLSGKEGFAGSPVLVGLRTSPSRVVMQVKGAAFRMSSKDLAACLRRCPELERRLLRYSQELGTQAAQIATCNRLHEVNQRLAR